MEVTNYNGLWHCLSDSSGAPSTHAKFLCRRSGRWLKIRLRPSG